MDIQPHGGKVSRNLGLPGMVFSEGQHPSVGELTEALAFLFDHAEPAVPLQIDFLPPEDNSFLPEQSLLSLITAVLLGERDSPFRIDNPMPWKAHPGGSATQGVSDAASLPDETAQSCDLPIRSNLAARDVLDCIPNQAIMVRSFHHLPERSISTMRRRIG